MTAITRRTIVNIVGTISGISVANPTDAYTISGLVAAVDLDAGDAVRINSSFAVALASAAASGTADVVGLVAARAKAGEAVTIVVRGRMSGFVSLAAGPVYLSDTGGGLDTAAGTVSTKVGYAVNATTIELKMP